MDYRHLRALQLLYSGADPVDRQTRRALFGQLTRRGHIRSNGGHEEQATATKSFYEQLHRILHYKGIYQQLAHC